MSIEMLDPTHEADAVGLAMAGRLPALEGKTVGVISNGKRNTIPFFDAFEHALVETHGVGQVVRRTKSNYSAPADANLVEEVRTWDALVAGIGD